MQLILHRVDLRFEIIARKFDGDKRMHLARVAMRLEIGLRVAIKADRVLEYYSARNRFWCLSCGLT